jgi:pilus assembly protein CpaD
MSRIWQTLEARAAHRRPATLTAATIGLIVLAIAGCDHGKLPDHAHTELTDPAKRHPISVVVDRAELDIGVHRETSRGRALANLEATRFARNYTKDGRGPILIAIPAKFEKRHASFDRVRDIQTILEREGVASENVRVRRKPSGHSPDSVTLSYDRIAAVGPICGDWSIDTARNPDDLHHANYGCAVQRNLAHMVANPTDLSFPAKEDDRGSDRRMATRKAFTETVVEKAKIESTKK